MSEAEQEGVSVGITENLDYCSGVLAHRTFSALGSPERVLKWPMLCHKKDDTSEFKSKPPETSNAE